MKFNLYQYSLWTERELDKKYRLEVFSSDLGGASIGSLAAKKAVEMHINQGHIVLGGSHRAGRPSIEEPLFTVMRVFHDGAFLEEELPELECDKMREIQSDSHFLLPF